GVRHRHRVRNGAHRRSQPRLTVAGTAAGAPRSLRGPGPLAPAERAPAVRARSVPVFTVGHSTRSLDELGALLREHGVDVVADVRTAPGSRRQPHFSRPALAALLPPRGLDYVHLPELGGFRRPRPDSPNDGWHNR